MLKKHEKINKKRKFVTNFNDFYVIAPKNTFIERGAQIGKNTIIYPNCYIDKNSKIGENCKVLPGCFIEGSEIGSDVQVGPFAHLRAGTKLGNHVRLGNFCETKNAQIGEGTKIAHLTYVGDAVVGCNCNFGCGVVFANFDGVEKHQTCIGDNCFIGCNVNLIAPLNIGNNVFIGAGSTVTQNLVNNTFALSRTPLETKNNLGFNKITKK